MAENVYVAHAPAESLPFEENAFTRAYSVEAIQHFQSPETFIQQLGRVVEAGGVVAVASFFATSKAAVPELTKMFPTIKRGIDKAVDINDMDGWLTGSGFRNVEVTSIGNNVWERFVEWRNQVKPENISTSWLDAYQQGLVDYYVVSADRSRRLSCAVNVNEFNNAPGDQCVGEGGN